MSLHSAVEALARALGVLWIDRDPLQVPSLAVKHRGGGLWRVFMGRERFDVDSPTAAIILLGHARGLRVDLGECPACNGTGDERAIHRTREAEAEARLAGWWCRGGNYETGASEWYRDCVACTIDGKPTGRHLLAWERAILDAMPKVSWVRRAGVDHGPFETPGDPTTRTALTVLAHRLADPEHASVFGDWCESGHEPAAFPGVPRSGFAALLAWWLAGQGVLGQHEREIWLLVQAATPEPDLPDLRDPATLGELLGLASPGV